MKQDIESGKQDIECRRQDIEPEFTLHEGT